MIGELPDYVIQYLLSYLGADDLMASCALLNKRFLVLAEETAKLITHSILSIYYPQFVKDFDPNGLSIRFHGSSPRNKTVLIFMRYLYYFCRPSIHLAGCKSSEVNRNVKILKLDIRSGNATPCADMSDVSPNSDNCFTLMPKSNTLVSLTDSDPPGESIIQFFDSFSNVWSTVHSNPVGLRFMTMVPFFSPTYTNAVESSSVQENLLIVGGVHQDSLEFSEDVYYLSSSSFPSTAVSLQSLQADEGVHFNNSSEQPKVQWSVLPLLPSSEVVIPRFGHCALSFSTHRYGKKCNLGPKLTTYTLALGGKTEGASLYAASTSLLSVQTHINSDGMSVPRGCWSKGPSMIVPRVWFHAFIVDDFVYAVGGDVSESGADQFPTIEKLAVRQGVDANRVVVLGSSWQQVAAFPRFRRNFTVSCYSSRLYIIGGRDEYYGPVHVIDVFNTETCTWEPEQSWQELDFLHIGGQAVSIPPVPYSW